jgi:hypothetical protein
MILAVEAMLILLAGAIVCVLTDVVSKRVASHSVPELQLLPSKADQTALLEDVGMMLTPSRLERYVGAIGLYALGSAALWIQTPFWLIGVVVVALIPCIAAVRYLTTRHRLRQLISGRVDIQVIQQKRAASWTKPMKFRAVFS